MTACSEGQCLDPQGALSAGLRIVEETDPTGPQLHDNERRQAQIRLWRVTATNPDFWWEILVAQLGADPGSFELRCTKCGGTDRATSLADFVALIGAGAHHHDTDPAGGC